MDGSGTRWARTYKSQHAQHTHTQKLHLKTNTIIHNRVAVVSGTGERVSERTSTETGISATDTALHSTAHTSAGHNRRLANDQGTYRNSQFIH